MERECKKEARAQTRQKIACQGSPEGFHELLGLKADTLNLTLICNNVKVNLLSVFLKKLPVWLFYKLQDNLTKNRNLYIKLYLTSDSERIAWFFGAKNQTYWNQNSPNS